MAVKKKLFLISIPFILAYLYFDSTINYLLARELKKPRIPVALNHDQEILPLEFIQDQEINELDPDCQCRLVVPKGLILIQRAHFFMDQKVGHISC